jgi:ferredoxin
MCKGCGTCVAACPAGAITGAHFSNEQIMAEIRGALWDAHRDGETAAVKPGGTSAPVSSDEDPGFSFQGAGANT